MSPIFSIPWSLSHFSNCNFWHVPFGWEILTDVRLIRCRPQSGAKSSTLTESSEFLEMSSSTIFGTESQNRGNVLRPLVLRSDKVSRDVGRDRQSNPQPVSSLIGFPPRSRWIRLDGKLHGTSLKELSLRSKVVNLVRGEKTFASMESELRLSLCSIRTRTLR